MCYAPSVQWGKPSWFQSEVHSHWSTSSRMAFWDMCLVSSLPRHWAGIVSFRVSRRALELERERQLGGLGRDRGKWRAGRATNVDRHLPLLLRALYKDILLCTLYNNLLQRCCCGQCTTISTRSAKIYSTVKDRPMHVEESSSWTKPHGELELSHDWRLKTTWTKTNLIDIVCGELEQRPG